MYWLAADILLPSVCVSATQIKACPRLASTARCCCSLLSHAVSTTSHAAFGAALISLGFLLLALAVVSKPLTTLTAENGIHLVTRAVMMLSTPVSLAIAYVRATSQRPGELITTNCLLASFLEVPANNTTSTTHQTSLANLQCWPWQADGLSPPAHAPTAITCT